MALRSAFMMFALPVRSDVVVEVERAMISVPVQGVLEGADFALERSDVKDLCFSSVLGDTCSVKGMLVTREERFMVPCKPKKGYDLGTPRNR